MQKNDGHPVRLDHRDPYQQARAHTAYLHYLQDLSPEWLKVLQKLAKRQGTAQRLLSLLQVPYTGILPVPDEALMKLIRNVKPKKVTDEVKLNGGKLNVRLSALEAPSARLAAKLMLDAKGASFGLTVSETFSFQASASFILLNLNNTKRGWENPNLFVYKPPILAFQSSNI